jgi:hypothetical protein
MIRRAGTLVATVLAVDAVLHLCWSTGLTWPAPDATALSLAVLGFRVPFTPEVLVPLVVLLSTAALLVAGRARLGRAHRIGWLLQTGTVAVTVGLLLRASAGVVWVCGIGIRTGTAFYWLNLLGYTPLCLVLGVAAAAVAGYRVTGRPGKAS